MSPNGDPSEGDTGFAAESALPEKEERTWGMICHIGAIAGYTIILGGVLVPLVIYLAKPHASRFVAEHAKESLNFQITVLIGQIIVLLPSICLLGIPNYILLAIAIGFAIIAGVTANDGRGYRYPLTLRLVR